MKPIYMEMSAFGPFSDITEVDFSKIGRNGIFLAKRHIYGRHPDIY